MNVTQQLAEDGLSAFFPMLEEPLRKKLAVISSVQVLAAGDRLMQTGQYFKAVMLVIKGHIKLYREGYNGEEFFIYQLQPGSACALSMVCGGKQETSEIMGIATEEAIIIRVPVEKMDELVKEYSSWYHFVIETYRLRFEELIQTLDDVVFKGMDERLHNYLRQQRKRQPTAIIELTHQQIAADLNSSREVISRLLKKMEQTGKVKLSRNFIELCD